MKICSEEVSNASCCGDPWSLCGTYDFFIYGFFRYILPQYKIVTEIEGLLYILTDSGYLKWEKKGDWSRDPIFEAELIISRGRFRFCLTKSWLHNRRRGPVLTATDGNYFPLFLDIGTYRVQNLYFLLEGKIPGKSEIPGKPEELSWFEVRVMQATRGSYGKAYKDSQAVLDALRYASTQ